MKVRITIWIILISVLSQSNIALGQDFKTVGYLPTYRFSTIDNIELDKLTHLNIAFANPDANGHLRTEGTSITSVVQQAHEAGLDVYIALAGAASPLSVWENWITPNKRSSFIKGIMEYVKKHDLQGIDVDIEWGTVNDDYSGFVLELRDSLNYYDLGLTVALPGIYRYPEITDEALAAFDWVNLMVYDLTGPWDSSNPGPHSPYSFAENSINYWLDQGLEKNRMTLGVPFYGYDFTDLNNIRALLFSEIVEMNEANATVDQVGEIYFNGLPTITQKTQLALSELSGIMIWELGQDFFGEFSLLKKINETIEEFTTTSTQQNENSILANPYPNPVIDHTIIKTNTTEKIKLLIFSQSLKMIESKDFRNQEYISVDMKNYHKGIYFLTLKANSFVKTFKLIKI